MKITLSGEYDKSIYWLNRVNWFCIFLMLACISQAASDNDAAYGFVCYIGLAINICSISFNRQFFLENEMFRLGRLILNENGGYK